MRMSKYKPFNRQVFEQVDARCRQVVKDYYRDVEGLLLVDNPDKYGIDLLRMEGERIRCGYELEVRDNWKDSEFPFETIHIPFRKQDYALMTYPCFHVSVNRPFTLGWVASYEEIVHHPVREVPNKYLSEGEGFYDVPFSVGEVVNLVRRYDDW